MNKTIGIGIIGAGFARTRGLEQAGVCCEGRFYQRSGRGSAGKIRRAGNSVGHKEFGRKRRLASAEHELLAEQSGADSGSVRSDWDATGNRRRARRAFARAK